MNTKKIVSTIHLIMIALFASACSAPTVPSWGKPTATSTPEIMSDCFISFKVAAWEDLNGDGVWNAAEPPLEGVKFQVQGQYAQQWGPDPNPSQGDGWFSIMIWSPGNCIKQEYKLSAVPPESYEPTTPAVVTFSDSLPLEAQFGFRAIPK